MDPYSEDAQDEFPQKPSGGGDDEDLEEDDDDDVGDGVQEVTLDEEDLDEDDDDEDLMEDDSSLQMPPIAESTFANNEEDIDDLEDLDEDLDDEDSMDMSEMKTGKADDTTTAVLSEFGSGGDDDEGDDDSDEEDDDGDDDEEGEGGSEEETNEEEAKTKKIPIMRIKTSEATGRTSSRSNTESPASMDGGKSTPTTVKRRPGRPSKAEMARRAKEKGIEVKEEEPKPKQRRGRKPRSEEEKARIKEERKEKIKAARAEKRAKIKAEKAALKAEKKKGRGRGRRAKVLTQEELDAREETRKAKYEELKRAKIQAKEDRLKRNEALRVFRKKKKEEEKRQREAFEKRMQALKASFLDENSHLSAAGTTATGDGTVEGALDETSQSSLTRGSGTGTRWSLGNEVSKLHRITEVTAETLFEYRWPPGSKTSEHYFLQEQVTEYLGIKSFKRKYPTTTRRPVEAEERDFLVEMRVVNETQADLGLTALPSTQVLDIMSNDFYEKYDEYMTVVSDRKDKTMRTTSYNTVKSTDDDFVDKSSRAAAEWNKRMNADRREHRASYFDMQTFHIHHPIRNRGKTRILEKPRVGHYPVALIPGQFVDYYRTFSSTQLSYLPLNTTLKAPPPAGARLSELDSDGREQEEEEEEAGDSESSSDSGSDDSSSSGSDSDSSSDSSSSSEDEEEAAVVEEATNKPAPMKRAIDAEIPGAQCRICAGDRFRNKIGNPEKLLHCSKCSSSCHPTCVGLTLELLTYVTSYNWECTECKVCSKCQDHSDEDKMLFCDLCDRGYHNYCVGLNDIPSGRWHCSECTVCVSCKVRDPAGVDAQNSQHAWVSEYKTNALGNKIFNFTMCKPCHRAWKRTQYCPECNVCYGREPSSTTKGGFAYPVEYASCMVCARQHHRACVAQSIFICAACQARTLAKTIGSGNMHAAMATPVVAGLDPNAPTPGRRGSRRSAAATRLDL